MGLKMCDNAQKSKRRSIDQTFIDLDSTKKEGTSPSFFSS